MKYNVSCSIVAYKNDPVILGKAIKSVLESSCDVSLHIYDNSPTDELRYLFTGERVIYYHDPANKGFSKGHNFCIKEATDRGSDYHLVLNPDMFFGEYVIEELVKHLEADKTIGLIAPKVLYPDGRLQFSCRLLPHPIDLVIRRVGILSKIFQKRLDRSDLKFTSYDHPMEVPFILGCFMLIPTHVFKEIGAFDERFFMYMEDFDLTRRIKKKYKTLFTPDQIVYHGYQRASGKNPKLLFIHIVSAISYFNKWGWFFDKERKTFNKQIVETALTKETCS